MSTKKAVRKGGNPKKKEEEEEEQERKREEEEEVDEEEEEEEEGEEGEEDAEEEDEKGDEEGDEEEEEGGKDKRAPEERAPPGKRSGVEDPECTPPTKDLPEKERRKLDKKVREKGETVVPGGTGGKTLETQERLAEGRCKGGHTRREQLGREGYQNMGRKGGLSTKEKSSEEREKEEGIEIDESTYRTRNK